MNQADNGEHDAVAWRAVTDDDSQPVEGEIVGPEGDGQWLGVPAASALTGTPQKTLYRRIERGQVPSRRNAEGRLEVWIEATPTEDKRLSPIVGINAVEVRELLEPLARALSDSQRQSEANLERALKAEAEVERLKARLSPIRQSRIKTFRSWWHFWILGDAGDSQ